MSADPRIGSVLDGHRIEEELGVGGMGVVYRAHHLRLKRNVALKLIRPDLAHEPRFRRRFDREMELAASIQHAHVISVHNAAETADGELYLSMQLVDGKDLRTLLDDEGPFDAHRAAIVVAQVGGALDAAHAQGLVHRDVKPSNILVARVKGGDHAYLTDFGVAKRVASEGSVTRGGFVGTMDYAAPEQIAGDEVDARSDVYALGCVLYRMLSGQVPFACDEERQTGYAHGSAPRPRLVERARRDVTPRTAAALNAVLAQAMAIDPAQRYASAGDLGRAAVAAADGLPPPRPEGSVARGDAAPRPRLPSTASSATASRGFARMPRPRAGASLSARHRRRRWSAVARVTLAVTVVAAAGAAVGTDRRSAASDAPTKRLSTARLELRVPASWRSLPHVPAILPRGTGTLAASSHDSVPTTVVATVLDAEGPALLPLAALHVHGPLPTPDAVSLGGLQALRYRGLRVRGVASPLTVFAVGTDRGVATVACTPDSKRSSACDAIAATLRVHGAHPVALGPSHDYAVRVNAILAHLVSARRSQGRALVAARLAGGQAHVAARLALAYARAAHDLTALRVGPADAAATQQVVTALRRIRDDYEALAVAANRGRARTYRLRRRSIVVSLRRLDAALEHMRDAGYRVG